MKKFILDCSEYVNNVKSKAWWACAYLNLVFIKVQPLQIVLRATQTLDFTLSEATSFVPDNLPGSKKELYSGPTYWQSYGTLTNILTKLHLLSVTIQCTTQIGKNKHLESSLYTYKMRLLLRHEVQHMRRMATLLCNAVLTTFMNSGIEANVLLNKEFRKTFLISSILVQV